MPDIVGAVVAVGFLVLWIYCIYDVITTDDAIVQHLPKVVWILIVVLLSDLGSLLWLGLGRPRVWARRANDPTYRVSGHGGLDSGGSDGALAGPNPIVQYREEQARLRLREERLNPREEDLRRRELGEG
jgi:Phospholipase_D-nuclease N-terminal